MTPENLLWAIGGAVYALIGARAAVVGWRNEVRIGRRDRVLIFWMFVMWPMIVMAVGLVTVVSGDAGIYDSTYRSKASEAAS